MSWLSYAAAPIYLWMARHAYRRSVHKYIIHDRQGFIKINHPLSQITEILYRNSVCKHRNKAGLDWFYLQLLLFYHPGHYKINTFCFLFFF